MNRITTSLSKTAIRPPLLPELRMRFQAILAQRAETEAIITERSPQKIDTEIKIRFSERKADF